jgi:AraC-like DNA-binding protein
VQEIGWAVGHADPSYFSRSFRRLTGQSPQDYRRGLNG